MILNGVSLTPLPEGALWWPQARTLVVADMHLEKGAAFAARGRFLPPYDTRATLAALDGLTRRLAPARVVCLGDTFHRPDSHLRLPDEARGLLRTLVAAVDWVWVVGNHDPLAPTHLGGRAVEEIAEAGLCLRHETAPRPAAGEVSGHFHPKARVRVQGARLSRPCFVNDGTRLILPAFGAFTGGLDVADPALRGLFAADARLHLTGRSRVHSLPARMAQGWT